MVNFNYYNTTRILSGKDVQKEVGTLLHSDNIKSVLLVYGMDSIKASGLLDENTAILEENRIKIIEHGGEKLNPVVSHANKGAALAKKHNVDAILAFAAGSLLYEPKANVAGYPYSWVAEKINPINDNITSTLREFNKDNESYLGAPIYGEI